MSEFDQRVADAHFLLTQLLHPFGWDVRLHDAGRGPEPAAEFRLGFTVTAADSLCRGLVFGKSVQLLPWVCRGGRGDLERVVTGWAMDATRGLLAAFAEAQLPAAPEIDWRPTETIPEDFSAR